MVETAANEVEFHFIVQAVAGANRLSVNDTDIVVLHSDGKHLLTAVESHGKDFLSLSCGWLPPSDKIVMVLARR